MGENLKFIVFGRSQGGILGGGHARDINEVSFFMIFKGKINERS